MTVINGVYRSSLTLKRLGFYFIIALAVIGIIMFLRGDNIAHFLLVFPALVLLFVGIYFFDQQKTQRIQKLFNKGKFLPQQSYEREEYVDLFDPKELWALIRKKTGKRLFLPVVNYPLSENSSLSLKADKGYPPEFLDTHPKIDILIDEEDYNNYYLDFDIKRADFVSKST